MKQIIPLLLCLVLLFVSCSGDKLITVKNSLFDPKQTLTPTEIEIYSNLKEDFQQNMVENFNPNDPTYYTFADIDRMKIHTIPYYEFNEDLFFEDPSYDRILTSCIMPENKVMFLGKLEGKVIALFLAHKRKSWLMEELVKGPDLIKNTIDWIHEKIAYPDSSHCRLVKIYALTYLAYTTKKGETTYYNFYSGKNSSNGILDYIMFTNKSIKEYEKLRNNEKKED